MIYQGPCVGSSKGNCCDRTQDIKNFEIEFHRPSTMSSYEKLKGFKKEREHLLDLEVQFWSSNNKTTSVRREDRNKNKLFIFFSYWHGPVQRVIISSFGFSHSVTFWVAADLAQISSLHPLWDCPPLAPDWRGYELQVPGSFLWLFHFLHSTVCESFPPWSQLSSFPREGGISSFLAEGKPEPFMVQNTNWEPN